MMKKVDALFKEQQRENAPGVHIQSRTDQNLHLLWDLVIGILTKAFR